MATFGTVRLCFRFGAAAAVMVAALAGCSDASRTEKRAENKVPELSFDGDVVRGSEVTMVVDGLGGLVGHTATIEIMADDGSVAATFNDAVVPEAGILRHQFYLPSRLGTDQACNPAGGCERPVLTTGQHRIKVFDVADRTVLADTTFSITAARPATYRVRLIDNCDDTAWVDFDGSFWLPPPGSIPKSTGGSTPGRLILVDATHARFTPAGGTAVDVSPADSATAAGLGC